MSYLEGTYNPEFFLGSNSASTESEGSIVRTEKMYETYRSFINPGSVSRATNDPIEHIIWNGTYFIGVSTSAPTIVRSLDGVTWEVAGNAPNAAGIAASTNNAMWGITANESTGRIVISSNASGESYTYYSTDHATSWTRSTTEVNGSIGKWLLHYSAYHDTYIATVQSSDPARLQASTDGGVTWSNRPLGMGTWGWRTMVVHPITGRLLVGADNSTSLRYCDNFMDGDSWQSSTYSSTDCVKLSWIPGIQGYNNGGLGWLLARSATGGLYISVDGHIWHIYGLGPHNYGIDRCTDEFGFGFVTVQGGGGDVYNVAKEYNSPVGAGFTYYRISPAAIPYGSTTSSIYSPALNRYIEAVGYGNFSIADGIQKHWMEKTS